MTRQVADYWDQYAAAYDLEPDHGLGDPETRGAWKALLRSWLPTRPGDIADLACGTGTLSVIAAELGHHVVGVDLSPEMVRRARAKTAAYGAAVRIEVADVSAPPLEPRSVDTVLARHIVWTLPDPQAALATWAGLVRPGGRMVLVEGRWAYPGDETYEPGHTMPWAGGVRATTLREACADLLTDIGVLPLTDPLLWGRVVDDERYLLVGTVR